MRQELTISNVSEIRQIVREINLFSTGNKKKLNVQLEGFSEEENKQLETKIQKFYSACGCSQGRITGIITMIGYVILVLTGIISIYKLGVGKTILLYLAFSFVTMFFGKIYGLRKARRQLIALASEVESKLNIT